MRDINQVTVENKFAILVPDNGWEAGVCIVKLCWSSLNPFPRPTSTGQIQFQPLRAIKCGAVLIGSYFAIGGVFGGIRGMLFPQPLSENAPTEQRIGHVIGASFNPLATGVMVGSKATLATIEANNRASEGTAKKATPVTRKLSANEVKMLDEFTGKTLLVNFQDNR